MARPQREGGSKTRIDRQSETNHKRHTLQRTHLREREGGDIQCGRWRAGKTWGDQDDRQTQMQQRTQQERAPEERTGKQGDGGKVGGRAQRDTEKRTQGGRETHGHDRGSLPETHRQRERRTDKDQPGGREGARRRKRDLARRKENAREAAQGEMGDR